MVAFLISMSSVLWIESPMWSHTQGLLWKYTSYHCFKEDTEIGHISFSWIGMPSCSQCDANALSMSSFFVSANDFFFLGNWEGVLEP